MALSGPHPPVRTRRRRATRPQRTRHDASYGIPENATENVTAYAGLLSGTTDADGDPLTASLVSGSGPSHGTATVNADGSFRYKPTTDYVGSDSFQYQVSDGVLTATGTVTLTAHAADTAPTANADSYSMLHDQELDVDPGSGVLANDSDAENDPMTASVASGPSNGTLTVNADGSFTYTPNAGWIGTDSFTYTASDGKLSSSPATVTISVTDPNAPLAADGSYSIERNNEYDADSSTGVLANDTDADGDTLTASLVSGPSNGTLTFNSDGSFSYTPTTGFTGTDSFTYQASDGVLTSNTATVTLTVSSNAPGAADQTLDVLENTALSALPGTLMLNASNPDNMSLTAQDVTQPQDGTVTVNGDGSFTYTPTSGFTGTDSFTYDLTDGTLTSDPATVTINVKPTNTAPTAADLSYDVDENTSLSTDSSSGVLSGAADTDGDTLFAALVSGPSNGTLTLDLDGSFTYTPNSNFAGTDSFQYKVFDGTTYSSPATVTLTVNADVPDASPDSYSVLSSGTTTVDADNSVLANDSDPDGATLTAVLVTPPSHGDLTLNSSDGSFTYTPGADFTGSDSFTYKASNSVNDSDPVTVMLTGGPVASGLEYSVTHDQTLTVDSTDGLRTGAYDADGDTLTIALASSASHGSVTVNGDGSFTYTPDTHYVGSDSFTYTASDATQTSQPATVTIDVTNVAPQAYPQSWDTPEDTALVVNAASGILAGSSDDDGDSLTAQVVGNPSNGSLVWSSNGSFTYTPSPSFFGTDSFSYEVSDGVSTSDPATVTITVGQVISENTPNSVYSAVAVAEGDTEVIVADQGLNNVSVFLVDGNGVLASTPISTIAVGAAPVALAVGDFNGDGHSDVAVANSGDGTVSILLGVGSGTFTTGTPLTGFSDPVGLAVGDFNDDGLTDLAVVNKDANTVSILVGNGNGTFTAGTPLSMGSSPTSVAAADFNKDGQTDLVVTNYASNTVSVFLGNGDSTFQAVSSAAVGTAPLSVTTGDFDGDGNVDLAVANSGSNDVSVLLGNGDGTFQSATAYAVGSDPVSIATGQFDGDGFLDLSVANRGSSTLTNLLNLGNGAFIVDETESVEDPAAIAIGDFNHDGLTDQVVALADPGLFIGPGTLRGAFKPTILAASADGEEIAGAGKDNAGDQFVVVWNADTTRRTTILKVTATVTGLAFSSDGNNLAIATWDADNLPHQGYVTIYSLKTSQIANELPVGPVAKGIRPGSRKPTSVAFSPKDTYLAVTDWKGDIEVWKDPLKANVTGLAILNTPATGTGAPLVKPSKVFFIGDSTVVGGFAYSYATYDLSAPITSLGTAKIPLNQTGQRWVTAYAGLPAAGGHPSYVAASFNNGSVEFDTVGPVKLVSVAEPFNFPPVVGLAFPSRNAFPRNVFAIASPGGITFTSFDPTKGIAAGAAGAKAVIPPPRTSLVAMASATIVPEVGFSPASVFAVFSDGTILEYDLTGKVQRTIRNSLR